MRNVCMATGWFSSINPHNNPTRSSLQLSPFWLWEYWRKYIECFVKPDHYFVYSCNCPVMPQIPQYANNWEILAAHHLAEKKHHYLDWTGSLMMGAQYALLSGMNYVYIEQDCFVYGLDKAIEWAQDKDICYGFGDNCSFGPGWGEQCFMFINNSYLTKFIMRMLETRVWARTDNFMEIHLHEIFKRDLTPWEFGCGRLRPIDFSKDMFYAQQLSNTEIMSFIEKVRDKWN